MLQTDCAHNITSLGNILTTANCFKQTMAIIPVDHSCLCHSLAHTVAHYNIIIV